MAEELQPHILRKFEVLQKLGKGAYGVVWKAVDKQTKQVVALKKVFDAFQNATDAQRTYRQVIFLQQLNGHPNIVSLLNIIKAQSPKDIYLVFDFMQTDLHAVIRGNIMQDVHKRYVMYQLLKGMKYMHSGELIHRDLKPSNILLDSQCLVKLADFGLARSIASVNQSVSQPIMTEYVATRWYRAPEILLGSSKYTKAVDMWSIGCILGELYVGKAIFSGNSTLNQVQKIIELLGKPTKEDIDSMQSVMAKECLGQVNFVKKKSFSTFFQNMPEDGLDLLRKLLVFNSKKRFTVEQALAHPYLQDFHDESEQITFDGVIEIAIDENTKYSIKEYREALYRQITKRQKGEKKIFQDIKPMQTVSENQLRRRQREKQQAQREQKRRQQEKQQKIHQEMLNSKNSHLRSSITGGDRFGKYQAPSNPQPVTSSQNIQNCQPRDSYSNNRKKETSAPKQNYYYHSSSSQNYSSFMNQNNGHNASKQKNPQKTQKGRSFYGERYDKQKMGDRTYTAQNIRRK